MKIGTNQFASANRPGRVFGTAKLEQIRKGAKGGGFVRGRLSPLYDIDRKAGWFGWCNLALG